MSMSDDDPFAGIETIKPLPDKPSDNLTREIERLSGNQDIKKHGQVIQGLRKYTVHSFIQYLKDNCSSHVDSEISVTLEAMPFSELDKIGERFLKK